MTQEKTKVRIQGEIVDLALKKTSNDKDFFEVKLQQPNTKFPTTCRAFDEALVERFKKAKKGMKIGLEIEEQKSEYQGKAITYRTVVGIVGATAAATPAVKEEPKPAEEAPLFPEDVPAAPKSHWDSREAIIGASWAIDQAQKAWQYLHPQEPGPQDEYLEAVRVIAQEMLAIRDGLANGF